MSKLTEKSTKPEPKSAVKSVKSENKPQAKPEASKVENRLSDNDLSKLDSTQLKKMVEEAQNELNKRKASLVE